MLYDPKPGGKNETIHHAILTNNLLSLLQLNSEKKQFTALFCLEDEEFTFFRGQEKDHHLCIALLQQH